MCLTLAFERSFFLYVGVLNYFPQKMKSLHFSLKVFNLVSPSQRLR